VTASDLAQHWGLPAPAATTLDTGPGAGGLSPGQFREATRSIFQDLADALAAAGDWNAALPLAQRAVHEWATSQAITGTAMVTPQTQAQLVRAVLDEQFGMGPLQPYLEDASIEEIDINGPYHVWLRRSGGRKEPAAPIAADDEDLAEMVKTWGLRDGQTPREFSASRPLLNAALRTGVRLSAIMNVTRHVHVSIRCHRLVDITLGELTGDPYRTVSPLLARFLAALVRARKNLVVTGGTGAGKTTLLRALAAEIDPDERIATLESEYEMFLDLMPERHRDVVAIEARQANSEGAGEITLHDLIPQALRLSPRRILVGEVRQHEVRPMLEAMNSGHEGSMTTIHANSAAEIFTRILMLAHRDSAAMNPTQVHLAVGLARPFVIHLKYDERTGARFVSEVIEVQPLSDGLQPSFNRVFAPGSDGRAEVFHTISDQAADDLRTQGFSFDLLQGGY
jgi:pilus assembly protein CpaF